jgi:hypothetical protein
LSNQPCQDIVPPDQDFQNCNLVHFCHAGGTFQNRLRGGKRELGRFGILHSIRRGHRAKEKEKEAYPKSFLEIGKN